MKKITLRILAALLVLVLAIQLIPVARTNPAVVSSESLPGPSQVEAVLRESCYNCHSNETKWPLYSYIAPLSWFLADHVKEGREHLNFSKWNIIPAAEQAELREEIWEETQEGEMPLKSYLLAHPGARLTQSDLDVLREWSARAPESEPNGKRRNEDNSTD